MKLGSNMKDKKISEFLINKPTLGLWLCRMETNEVVLITDCYDTNPNWLHLLVMDKEDVDYVMHYTGDGFKLSSAFLSKYPYDTIINSKDFLEHHTITPVI